MGFFSHRKDRQSEAATSQSSGRRRLFASFSRHDTPPFPGKDKKSQLETDTTPPPASSESVPASGIAATEHDIQIEGAVAPGDNKTSSEDSTVTEANAVPVDDRKPASPAANSSAPKIEEEEAPAPAVAATQSDQTVLTSAYQKAWQSLTPDDRKDLALDDGLRQLLVRLEEADAKDRRESLLRRGILAVAPFLGPLQTSLDFVGTFASAEPIAGTAIGVVKGVASVGLVISSAAQDLDLTLLIGGVLELLPVVERCDKVVGEGKGMEDVYSALCDVYKDLLKFYVKATRLLKKSNFVLRMALNMLKPELPDTLASFNKHALVLSRLVEVETFAAVQDIKYEQVETLIRDTLDVNRGNEIAYHNELKQRADEACQWITRVDAFRCWQLTLDNSNFLAMFGDMGCGKTMTTAYVVDYLSARKSVVCAYYCKSDQQTTSLGNIYRSLVWQLLKRRPGLRDRYWEWYKDTEPRSQVGPAQSESHLQEFLGHTISSSQAWTFVVLDALDELETRARKQLLGVLRRLVEGHSRLKVFVSSRYREDIVATLPTRFIQVEVPSLKERDLLIAEFLVDRISNIPWEIRGDVVSELAAKANGSAIWLRIAIEYLEKVRIKTPKGLRSHLERLPSSKGLAELYWKLFDKVCSGIPENEERVRLALEMLAVAQRPLTPEELAYAVTLDPDADEPVTTVAELAEVVAEVDLLELIRPFVSVTSAESDSKSRQLRLVHQSAKEIILQAPPDEWQTLGKLKPTGRETNRYGALNGLLLRQCVKYLLLDECGTRELPLGSGFGVEHADDLDFLQMDMVGDADDDLQTERQPGESDVYDPVEFGFGAFFVYAAVYWTAHFAATDLTPEHRPDPEDLAVLCAQGSRRLANWVAQHLRPRCTYQMESQLGEEMANLDPLVVAAMFGPAESVADLVSRTTDAASVWRAVTQCIRLDRTQVLEHLVHDEVAGQILYTTEFFYKVLFSPKYVSKIFSRSLMDALAARSAQYWEALFEFVISKTRDQLLEEGHKVLCLAAATGCLPLVKKLFEKAESDPQLKATILSVRQRPGPGVKGKHQSVGEAAYEAQAEVLKFLCAQPGIEPHLFFVDDNGRTVFHQAARRGKAEIFRTLIERWPEGLNQKDNNGDSPIQEVIYNNQCGNRDTTRTIKEILATGAADVTGRTDGEGASPLACAVRQGNVELCRVLVVNGSADVACVVEVSQQTRKPTLRPGAVPSLMTAEEQDKMLKELCSLLPLAVSTEYLF